MNKQDAAEYLNISVRTLQRLTTDGKISVGEVRGRTGLVTDYTTEDLDHYKQAEREANPRAKDATRYVRPHVIPPDTALTSSSEALQRAGSEQGMAMLGKAIADALQAHQTPAIAASDVPLRDKMTLSFKEAAKLSGVPVSHLRAAHTEGSLRGGKIGRGVRVKRDDLEAYVKKL
jgi:excisionase family DNA binding protein